MTAVRLPVLPVVPERTDASEATLTVGGTRPSVVAAEQAMGRQSALEAARSQQVLNDRDEEPLSKALENRLRVAFLSTKGHTMAMWLVEREAILAAALGNHRQPPAS